MILEKGERVLLAVGAQFASQWRTCGIWTVELSVYIWAGRELSRYCYEFFEPPNIRFDVGFMLCDYSGQASIRKWVPLVVA